MSLPLRPSSALHAIRAVIPVALSLAFIPALSFASPFASLPASARQGALLEGDVPQLVATLVASSDSARIGVLFELAPDWHLYWRNPGETGVAPELGLRVDGQRVGALEWPVPETFREADDLFLTYGYSGRVLLAAELEPAAELAPAEPASIAATDSKRDRMARADVRALLCRTECVPVELSLALPLPASNDAGASRDAASTSNPAFSTETRAAIDALFAENAARIAPPADALGWHVEAAWREREPALEATGSIALSIDPCPAAAASGKAASDLECKPRGAASAAAVGAIRAAFLPFESETLEFEREQRITSPSASTPVALELAATRLEETKTPRLRGLVAIPDEAGTLQYAEIDVPLPAGNRTAAASTPAAGAENPKSAKSATPSGDTRTELAWLHVLLLALVGGFILNGMPCVLPVLAIKVVSVAEMAERDPREVRLHGLAYTAGILGSMLVLAALVVAMRAAGHAVGWGFQFQEPLFVAGIAALLVTFALNLFGVFEIELGQGRLATVGQESTGVSRSAFEGLLAVVLATPCTAPFLGTAVGFAFASGGFLVTAIFLAIGLGLASPFLVVSFRPALARFIPRSGAWMLKLRAGLGFCLLGTVLWLLWIVGQSGGTDAVVSLLAALLFLSFLLWLFGQLQPMRSLWLGRTSAVGIALLAFGSFNLIDFETAATHAPLTTQSAPDAPHSDADPAFRTYDEAAIRATLAQGVPVFVVFTADWCITCKVNERTVLDRASVREMLEREGYALFKADWTRRDEAIRARLADFGRAGVPLYLVYDPAEPDHPRVLSELLTEKAVLAALRTTAAI